jgi:hypothetical protein
MIQENKYFEKTVREMRKDISKLIDEISTLVLENESNHAVVLSRLDSVCSLLQITQIHISNLISQNKCATKENAEDSAKNEATAAEETTLI